jgi:hypothetical protein
LIRVVFLLLILQTLCQKCLIVLSIINMREVDMAVEEYDDRRHMARDVRDAHISASTAKTLATLALIGAAIALAVSIMAWNKANDAWGNAQQALNASQKP